MFSVAQVLLKSSVVSRRSLAEAAHGLRLEERARVGGGMRERSLPKSVLANLYEAVLGAVYLDAGRGLHCNVANDEDGWRHHEAGD